MVRRIAALPLPPREASRRPEQISAAREARAGKVSEESVGKVAVSGFGIFRRGKTDSLRGPWRRLALKTQPEFDFRGARVYISRPAKTKNGNSGLEVLCDVPGKNLGDVSNKRSQRNR